MSKIKNIFKAHPILVSTIFLLILFTVLLLLDSHNWNDVKCNLISGTSTEILGAIVTLWIVQTLLDKYNENLEEKDERRKILNSHKILDIFIEQYKTLLSIMITDYGKYDEKKERYILQDDFNVTQLQYAHNICLLLNKSSDFSNIHFFLKNELELRDLIISMIQNIDFHYHDDIYQQLRGYVDTSIKYDVRQAIEKNDNIIKSERAQNSSKYFDFLKDLMANHIQEFMQSLKEERANPSNLMYPYVILYYMINTEKEFLCNYLKLLEVLKNKK